MGWDYKRSKGMKAGFILGFIGASAVTFIAGYEAGEYFSRAMHATNDLYRFLIDATAIKLFSGPSYGFGLYLGMLGGSFVEKKIRGTRDKLKSLADVVENRDFLK